jgi:hypothetical protein
MSLLKYEFATEDGLTPSSCEIRLGDIDPMTGQPITDESVFKGYYQCVNREVRVNLKQIRLEKTKEERRKTNELKAGLSARFEQEHGYKPNEDIEIKITGLRPGEKLYEERLMAEEGLQKTENEQISIGKPLEIDEEKLAVTLDKLKQAAHDDSPELRALVKELVPTFQYQ